MLQPIYTNVPSTTGPYPAARCVSPTAPPPIKCRSHTGNKCAFLCTKCVTLLCDTCLSLNNEHSQCPVITLNTVSGTLCGQMKQKLSSQIMHMQTKLKRLHQALVEKKQRLLEKRNTTRKEVEGYFKRLHDKLQEALKERELSLIKELNDSVNEQDVIVSQNIEQCHTSLHSLREKHLMLNNLDRIYTLGNGNSLDHVKRLAQVSDDVSGYNDSVEGFEAARDAFLVIRFFVNTETEHTLLNSKIACMEVLNSRSQHNAEGSLESERIAEVSSSVSSDGSASNRQSPDADDVVNARSQDVEHDTDTPDLVFSSAQYVENEIINTVSQNTESSNRSQPLDSSGPNRPQASSSATNTSTSDANGNGRPRSGHENSGSSRSTNTSTTTTEEEPPPPYPGISPVTQPGPGETPPPYPGPPPPPYRQYPESQRRNPRGRLPGVSGNATRGQRGGSRQLAHGRHRHTSPLPHGDDRQMQASGSGPLQTFSTSELNDKRSAGIFAMVAHNEHSFLIIDRWNKKLKYFDDNGASKGGLLFRQEPWDITRVINNVYAVTVPDLRTIYKVQATVTAVVTISTIATERKYACITYHDTNELFVCGRVPQFGEPVIDLIGVNGGPILLTFNSDLRGQSLFSYPRYTSVSRDGTAVVCDWNMKCLVLFKLDGTVVGRYRGTQENPLVDPTGIVINQSTGSIYVIDAKVSDSGCSIHRLSLKCQMEEVIRVSPEIRDARAIACAGDKIITGSRKGIVHVFTANESHAV